MCEVRARYAPDDFKVGTRRARERVVLHRKYDVLYFGCSGHVWKLSYAACSGR
jgi:hypothetical protein